MSVAEIASLVAWTGFVWITGYAIGKAVAWIRELQNVG